MSDQLLDIFLTILHLGIIGFNVGGWIFPVTRKAHTILVGLTIFSWIGLGFFYGFGYCFITDWHWDVKRRLGEHDLPASYIKYFVDKTFHVESDPAVIDMVTGITFLGVVIITLYLNFRKKQHQTDFNQA